MRSCWTSSSVGRSLPGTMIGNVAYLFGYRQAGILGGVFSVVGMVLPPMIILSVLTYCYVLFQEYSGWPRCWVVSGLRWCPLSSPPAIKLSKGAFPEKICYALCIGGCVLNLVFGVNCVVVILLGVAAGLLMGKWKEADK